jgi:hypothetical protein
MVLLSIGRNIDCALVREEDSAFKGERLPT